MCRIVSESMKVFKIYSIFHTWMVNLCMSYFVVGGLR